MSFRPYIVPSVIAVFSLIVIWASLQLDLSPPIIVGDSMQPRAFPIFLMALNLILVALLVLQIKSNPTPSVPLEPFATWGSIALMIVFYGLTQWLDMFIGIAVVMFCLSRLWGERRIWVSLTTALLTPVLIFLLFDKVLRIRFPRGVITNWWYG